MIFEVEKTFTFEAGHVLTHHDGLCARPHGHSYTLKVAVRGTSLTEHGPKQGMIVDFHQISLVVRQMLQDHFDHHWLNETLQTESPTAEIIARWIFDYLQPKLPGLDRVSVGETASSTVSYINES